MASLGIPMAYRVASRFMPQVPDVAYRVARRFIEGGLFEAPPAMLESVGGWISAIYAGSVLAFVEKRLANLRDRVGVLDSRIEEMKATREQCARDIKALKPGKTLRYQVWRPSPGLLGVRLSDVVWDKEGESRVHFVGEVPQDPQYEPLYDIGHGERKLEFPYSFEHNLVDDAIRKVQEVFTDAITRTNRVRERAPTDNLTDSRKRSELVELLLLRRECLKHTSVPKEYAAKARKKFEMDLTGWKYLRSGSPIIKRVNEKIEKRNADRLVQIEVAKKSFALATKAYDLAQAKPTSEDLETEDWTSDPKVTAIIEDLDRRDWLPDFPHSPAWDGYRTRQAIYQGERPEQALAWRRTLQGNAERVPISVVEKDMEPLLGPDDVIQALATEGWGEILVQLDFKGHKKTLGTWMALDRTITVDIRGQSPTTVGAFQESLDDILRTTRHELQHVAQDVLTRVLGLKQEAGTPSQDIRVQPPSGKKPSERKEHALREEEFYTRLSDEIERFVAYARRRPKETLNRDFRLWVNLEGSGVTEFFSKLKQHEPLKWQKAVKEFLKGINARGVVI